MKSDNDIIEKIKEQMSKQEIILSDYATKYSQAIRLKEESKDLRLDFARDIDRIIHSPSYTRYLDKTQVYSDSDNFNISKRMTHVQFVSRAAKTIARSLGLNEDLCEAISLGHDVGHAPFGHFGERVLNNICKKRTGKCFAHNLNSVRILKDIEKRGAGLNLTIQVLDGIMCHNGEMVCGKYAPVNKTIDDFLNEYNVCLHDESKIKSLIPMTLEGCVVRISDVIGYLGKDIDDASNLEVFDLNTIPQSIKKVLGSKNVDIMNNIIMDVTTQSFGKNYIQMSPVVFEQVEKLKKFNLYNLYMNALENDDRSNDIFEKFLNNLNDDYVKKYSNDDKVIDYIASMTDTFFVEQYNKYFENDKVTKL